MLKFLARNTSNEAAIRNLEDSRAKKEAQMGVLKAQRLNMDIRRVFQKCGLDPYDNDKLLFEKHLESLSQEAMYDALTKRQTNLSLI